MRVFKITGHVIDSKTQLGVKGLRVEAWDNDLIISDLVGGTTTGDGGIFRIQFYESYFKELFLDRRPDLFFKIFRGDNLIKDTKDSVIWNVDREDIEVTIEVENSEGTITPEVVSSKEVETRSILQATYTPRKPRPEESPSKVSKGLEKGAFFSYLAPSEEELDELTECYTQELKEGAADTMAKKKDLKTTEVISTAISETGRINVLRSARLFAKLEVDALCRVAQDLVGLRKTALDTISGTHKTILEEYSKTKTAPPIPGATVKELMDWAIKNNVETKSAHKTIELGSSLSLNLQKTELDNFKTLASRQITRLRKRVDECEESLAAEHIGYLHLEKMSLTPAGIERGRLVHSVPLSPGEEVNIRQREWSRTSEEFERIVTDYLEEFSEEGVTEKTELAQSVNSQKQHSNAFNTAVSTSGEAWGFSITASVGYNASESASKSEQITRNHTRELTSKASSRSKQEHKISFRVASARETEDETVQRIKNPFPDRATRVDYYQLIRKWQVDLYRYGIRLTYDIAIPEPGSGLLAIIREIQRLQEELTRPFELEKLLGINASEISLNVQDDNYYGKIVLEHGITLAENPPPLYDGISIEFLEDYPQFHECQSGSGSQWTPSNRVSKLITKDVKPGYEVSSDQAASIRITDRWRTAGGDCYTYRYRIKELSRGDHLFSMIGGRNDDFNEPPAEYYERDPANWDEDNQTWKDDIKAWIYRINEYNGWAGLKDSVSINIIVWDMVWVGFSIQIPIRLQPAVEQEWKQKIWNQIYEFMIARYYEKRQLLKERLAELTEKLGVQDALSLRKKEREEVMKGVLRFLICPNDFEFFPDNIFQAGDKDKDFDKVLYELETTGLLKNEGFRGDLLEHGKMIKFLHHAIEWENMLYFLYPYFWTHPTRWEFKKYLDHPDPMHRAFLKAGSARVVLTIRPGFEDAFLAFINTGDMNDLPPSPYLEIGQEFKNYANTNYPGIPPANPVDNYRPLLYPKQKQAWEDMQLIMRLLDEYRMRPYKKQRQAWRSIQKIMEFVYLYHEQNDEYPASLAVLADYFEDEPVPRLDPWGFEYVYIHPGIHGDFDVASYGADQEPGGEGENEDITSWRDWEGGEYPSSLEELRNSFEVEEPVEEHVPMVDPWGNPYVYTCPGIHSDYDLASYGKDGEPGGEGEDADITSWAEASLIGQWFEYTPTSALDIAFDETMPKQ